MNTKERYSRVMGYLESHSPHTDTELNYRTPFELLVATILSAQCTDKRVNQVTQELFKSYPTPELMALATPNDILHFIRSVSYPNQKSRYLVGCAQIIVNEYGGEIPKDAKRLCRLPGVGRKTANVVRAIAFGQQEIAVDTHVFRVSHRLGLVPASCTTPLSVEKRLAANIPAEKRAQAHFWLLYHGRYTCTSRSPHCAICGLNLICPYFAKTNIKGNQS